MARDSCGSTWDFVIKGDENFNLSNDNVQTTCYRASSLEVFRSHSGYFSFLQPFLAAKKGTVVAEMLHIFPFSVMKIKWYGRFNATCRNVIRKK